MRWVASLFLMLLILFIPGIGLALTCDDPTASETTRVYFVNGMNNTSKRIRDSRRKLADLIGGGSDTSFGSSINNKEGILEQLLEVIEQRGTEPSHFWEWLQDTSIAPQWFQDEFHTQMITIANLAVYQDLDLKIMVEEYLQDLRSGKKVVLVSHSQGNFYANNAYQFIKDTTNYASDTANSIGIVAVGTPSGRVQDDGPHTTNTLDLIVNLVRLGYYVLPANMTYNEPGSHTNHSFTQTYLTGAGYKIKSDVYSAIGSLQSPPLEDECKLVELTTGSAYPVSSNNARLAATVTSGKNVDVWFNAKKDSSPASCTSTSGPYDGQGSASQGQIVYEWANSYISLQPNAMYHFRACAKNDPGDIGQGLVESFRTRNAVTTKVATRTPTNITRTSALLKGYITAGNSIDWWFSPVSTASSNAVCTAGNRDGMGNGNTGETKTSYTPSPLNPNTTYYYRFCGKGYDGIKSGGATSFTTGVVETAVTTLSSISVGEDTATIRGEIGSGDSISYWWVVNTSSSVSCDDTEKVGQGAGSTGDVRQHTLSDLFPSTKYYYRFCGLGADGDDEGIRKIFTTDDALIACGEYYEGSSEGLFVTLRSNSNYDVARVYFKPFVIPDKLDVYYFNPGGQNYASTGGFTSLPWNVQIPFDGDVRFYVTGNEDTNTLWTLAVVCYDSEPF